MLYLLYDEYVAELTREVSSELRFDPYDESGEYFTCEQPP